MCLEIIYFLTPDLVDTGSLGLRSIRASQWRIILFCMNYLSFIIWIHLATDKRDLLHESPLCHEEKERDLFFEIYQFSNLGTPNSETPYSLQHYLVLSMDCGWGFPQHVKIPWKLRNMISLFLAKAAPYLGENFPGGSFVKVHTFQHITY